MKNIITLCVFVFAIAFGSQNLTAQSEAEFEKMAFTKVQEASRTIKIDKAQKQQITKVLTKYYKYKNKPTTDDAIRRQRHEKIGKYLDERLKEILTEDQFMDFKKIKLE